MVKNRYFLGGLGIGLIVAALLLQLINAAAEIESQADAEGSSLSNKNGDGELISIHNQDELKKELERKGYLVYTEAELESVVQERTNVQINQLREQSASKETPETKEVLKIALYLPGGLNTEQISQALEISGVLQDREQFMKEVRNRDLGKVIRAGYYEFDGPQEVEQVIERITGKRK